MLHRKIKCLRINLTKDVKDLYLENYKTLKKEIEGDTNKGKYILCSWIGRINVIKMSILPKTIYWFNVTYQYPNNVFYRTRTNTPKIYMEPQKTSNRTASLRKKNKVERMIVTDIKPYYKAIIVIKTVWYWHKNRHIDQ